MTEIIQIDIHTPLQFAQQDFQKTIIESLYAESPDLASILLPKIRSRTPILTGALRADEYNHRENTSNFNDPTLVEFKPGSEAQVDAWGRVYAEYIEGLLPSITIASPAEMYARSETEDIDDIEDWAYAAIEKGAKKLAASQGVPYP